jgi:hypothetical protein
MHFLYAKGLFTLGAFDEKVYEPDVGEIAAAC